MNRISIPLHLSAWKTSTQVVLLLSLVLMFFATGCAEPEAQSNNEDNNTSSVAENEALKRFVRVEAKTVESGTFRDFIELTGAVDARNDATLSAQAAGTVIYQRSKGSQVSRGSVVAQIDTTLAGAAYRQALAQKGVAMAQFELAQDTYNRQEPLFQDSIISAIEFQQVRTQFAQATATLRQAEASVAQLKEQFENTSIRAPFAGTVEAHYIDLGEQAGPGMAVARIVNIRTVDVQVGVPERYAGDITTQSEVEVSFDSYNTPKQQGQISFVGNTINPDNRTFPVEIRLTNEQNLIKPEMVARVMLVRGILENVLAIPQGAIPLEESGTSVFVVHKENDEHIARRTPITLGPSSGGLVVVENGINPGDLIVVAGQNNLSDGDPVVVVNTDSEIIAGVE